jgi:hypothetical protein
MTDKIAGYFYGRVILAKLQCLATGQCFKDVEINQVEKPRRALLKHKCGLPSSTSNSGNRIPCLTELRVQKDYADFQVWTNRPTTLPMSVPAQGPISASSRISSSIQPSRVALPSASRTASAVNKFTVLGRLDARKAGRQQLLTKNILFLSQPRSYKGTIFRPVHGTV